MKTLLLMAALGLFSGVKANAETIHFVNGERKSAREAEDMSADSKNVVIKVQANRVTRSEKTGNLKKSDDPSLDQLKNLKF